MIYCYPIHLENSMTFTEPPTEPLHFSKCNGYDGDNLRITNIVGYENGDFLKVCPHCNRILPTESFRLRSTIDRDQSWCIDCR